MTTNPDIRAAAVDRRWMAYHVFYGGNPEVLLQECLLPLAAQLEEEGLVRLSFYINYWLEGGHVRLRLLPADETARDEIHGRVMPVIGRYLERRPSMHPMARIESRSYYDDLFALEYGDELRPRYFDAEGRPLLRPNNTVEPRDYEPELERYGGRVGMVISEDFFADSTRLAREVIDLGNTGTRTILLGIGAEVMAVTAAALLEDRDVVMSFLRAYHSRWAGSYGVESTYAEDADQPRYRRIVDSLREAVVPVIESVLAGTGDRLPGFLGDWARTCAGYRRRIEDAVAERAIVFLDENGDETRPDHPSNAAWRLGMSFIHMTNNRLMVSIEDEAYLAFEILQAMEAGTTEAAA